MLKLTEMTRLSNLLFWILCCLYLLCFLIMLLKSVVRHAVLEDDEIDECQECQVNEVGSDSSERFDSFER